ncbi:MAG: hypothetical protein KatS3mg076_0729 [Candidatus Binatia bacterium]|nr:MAG: hypothetical protein KatS3mg076_0729 [Candidatus Binatia bacterium]
MSRATLESAVVPTKQRILATAEEVFAEKGFDGASTREIAARAGVNISSLHYHWESKAQLYVAVFRDIYDRLVTLVRSVGRTTSRKGPESDVVEEAMGRLFDFFCDHPTVPKLLVRRFLEEDGPDVEIEREVFLPAWKVFSEWTRHYRRSPLDENQSTLFMLTVHSVMLLFLLDSREFRQLLGGSVRKPPTRERVRRHVVAVVRKLLEIT